MRYIKGTIVEEFGSEYLVEDVYQLTDKELLERNLVFKNRVKLVKISGAKGSETLEFAIPD